MWSSLHWVPLFTADQRNCLSTSASLGALWLCWSVSFVALLWLEGFRFLCGRPLWGYCPGLRYYGFPQRVYRHEGGIVQPPHSSSASLLPYSSPNCVSRARGICAPFPRLINVFLWCRATFCSCWPWATGGVRLWCPCPLPSAQRVCLLRFTSLWRFPPAVLIVTSDGQHDCCWSVCVCACLCCKSICSLHHSSGNRGCQLEASISLLNSSGTRRAFKFSCSPGTGENGSGLRTRLQFLSLTRTIVILPGVLPRLEPLWEAYPWRTIVPPGRRLAIL